MCLWLQMTPTEMRSYRRKHCRLLMLMLVLALLLIHLVPPPSDSFQLWIGLFLIFVFYRLRYWRIDPVTVAMVEYNEFVDADVKAQCDLVRQQRIDAGL